jgi:hypothetical protein
MHGHLVRHEDRIALLVVVLPAKSGTATPTIESSRSIAAHIVAVILAVRVPLLIRSTIVTISAILLLR